MCYNLPFIFKDFCFSIFYRKCILLYYIPRQMFELAKLLAERLSVTVCYGYPQNRCYQTRSSLYENINAGLRGDKICQTVAGRRRLWATMILSTISRFIGQPFSAWIESLRILNLRASLLHIVLLDLFWMEVFS